MQLTVRDVCHFLKEPDSQMQPWVRDGGLPHLDAGGVGRSSQSGLFATAQRRTAFQSDGSRVVKR